MKFDHVVPEFQSNRYSHEIHIITSSLMINSKICAKQLAFASVSASHHSVRTNFDIVAVLLVAANGK